VFRISELEEADFWRAGIEFTEATGGKRGEGVTFEIGEDDPRWGRVAEMVASLQGSDRLSKKFRVQDISMAMPTLKESLIAVLASFKARNESSSWLYRYSGQTVDQLLSLEGKCPIDHLVLHFEEAIAERARHDQRSLTDVEQVVLAVEALEREVNNGGYHQFFTNSSREFAATIVASLQRIGCEKAAKLTQKAIDALDLLDLSAESIGSVITTDNKNRVKKLQHCDDAYYRNAEPIAERLFAFIKANKEKIRL
jgi:hypothetical protein